MSAINSNAILSARPLNLDQYRSWPTSISASLGDYASASEVASALQHGYAIVWRDSQASLRAYMDNSKVVLERKAHSQSQGSVSGPSSWEPVSRFTPSVYQPLDGRSENDPKGSVLNFFDESAGAGPDASPPYSLHFEGGQWKNHIQDGQSLNEETLSQSTPANHSLRSANSVAPQTLRGQMLANGWSGWFVDKIAK